MAFAWGDFFGNAVKNFIANIITDATTARTISTVDRGMVLRMTSASAVTITLPNSLPAGFSFTLIQMGAGLVSFTAAGGGTLRNRQSQTKSAGQYAMMTLIVNDNSGGTAAEWVLAGDTGT